MRIRFKCFTNYVVGDTAYKLGDIIEAEDDKLVKNYPHLFEVVKDKKRFTKEELSAKTVNDLQKLAEKYKIRTYSKWLKAELVDNLFKELNNE